MVAVFPATIVLPMVTVLPGSFAMPPPGGRVAGNCVIVGRERGLDERRCLHPVPDVLLPAIVLLAIVSAAPNTEMPPPPMGQPSCR